MAGDIIISDVKPQIDGGLFPAKRVAGDVVEVTASIYSYGIDALNARIRYRRQDEIKWSYSPMELGNNDTWAGSFNVEEPGTYLFGIEAWVDQYGTWLQNIKKWHMAEEDISQDLEIGYDMIRSAITASRGNARKELGKALKKATSIPQEESLGTLSSKKIIEAVKKGQRMIRKTSSGKMLKVYVERKRAGFSSWYELFPRSQGVDKRRSGTFKDVVNRLDAIKSMGFDVLYLTPIHPIGFTNRRGKDGSLKLKPGDPGSPWAIGNEKGGHKSIESSLGTLDDFRDLVAETTRRGMEIALDIAFQCSPDHPYVKEHPEWFFRRPDGTIRYAENPPKKYYDIYPLNFATETRSKLYQELLSIFLFWAEQGVKIFRVET